MLQVDPLEVEVGYGLIKLVDKKQGGDLLDRITNIRRQIAIELGLIVPPIRIRDRPPLDKPYELRDDERFPGRTIQLTTGSEFLAALLGPRFARIQPFPAIRPDQPSRPPPRGFR